MVFIEVQEEKPPTLVWGAPTLTKLGVQRAKPFAGVRGPASGGCNSGLPKNPIFILQPAAAR